MKQLGPILTSIVQEQSEQQDASIKGMISEGDAVNSVVDGVTIVVLEKLAMATALAIPMALSGGKKVDLSKIQRGRVKIVEGLLEMLEGQEELLEFVGEEQVLGDADVLAALREFIDYNTPEQEAA